MIETQTFDSYPEFANSGTKQKPEDAKYSAGFIPGEVLPAEYLNWFLNGATKGVTALETGVTEIETEINNILAAVSLPVDPTTHNQVVTAIISLIENKTGILSNLTTTAKTNLVAAVNELVSSIGTTNGNVTTVSNNLAQEVLDRQSGDTAAKDLANATGTLAVTHGGTGSTTKTDAINNLCSDIAASTIANTDKLLFQKTSGDDVLVKNISLSDFADDIYLLIQNRITNITVPTGTLFPFGGDFGTDPSDPLHKYDLVPLGFLACDGHEENRVTRSDLFNVIGTKYGNGDTITTFNVPDFRETVLVGAGQSTRTDIASHDVYNVGEFKDDQFASHGHRILAYKGTRTSISNVYPYSIIASNMGTDTNSAEYATNATYDGGHGGIATPYVENSGNGTTTHGKQIGVNYIIKY